MTHALRDFFSVIRRYGVIKFFRRLYAEVNADNVFTNAAAMAYAWMFAVFPFVIFLLTLFPYLPDDMRERALSLTKEALAGTMTAEPANAIMSNVGDVLNKPRGGLLSFGLLLTLYAASGGMNTTMSAIDQAFDVSKPRPYLVKRFVAMMLTLFMCVALIIIVLAMPVGTMLTNLIQEYSDKLPAWSKEFINGKSLILLTVARYIIGLTVLQILIGVIYYFGRSERDRLTFFSAGAILAGVGWIISGLGMRIYVENFANFPKTYGAVAAMVIMLMVFYINAVVILIGAELDSEVKHVKAELNSAFAGETETSRPHG